MDPWKRNGTGIVGILVVSLCLLAPIAIAGSGSVGKERSVVKDPVTFVYTPANGVYWNDRKLMDLPVPLFLHYHFRPRIPMGISVFGDGITKVVFYLNGAQQFIDTEPPYQWILPPMVVPMFGHTVYPVMVEAWVGNDVYVSDNLTVYRLFL